MPVVKAGSASGFTLLALETVHSSLKRTISHYDKDRIQVFLDFFVPATYYQMRAYMEQKLYSKAVEVGSDAIHFANMHFPIKDYTILTSANLEQYWNSLRSPKAGSVSRIMYSANSEFVHHETLAVTCEWNTGYTKDRTPMEEFCEFLDVLVAEAEIKISSRNAAVSKSSLDVYKKEGVRRIFDNSTTLKDILHVVESSQAPDVVFHELARYKKNPRYVELCVQLIKWTNEMKMPEAAVRMSLELEDWLAKRNGIMQSIDGTSAADSLNAEAVKKKKSIMSKVPIVKSKEVR
jgi:hypothetical protein